MSKKRQLAAIMFTDIEGYTSLMQANEEQALLIRTRHRKVFERATSKHNGEIVQYFGDGTLSIFKSSVEAVNCAIEMQLAFKEEPEIPVRIGIHIGDILYSKHDIVGDAVNIASRIESIGLPGSILISDEVNKQITSHENIQTKYLHNFQFKNVENAIPVHAVSNPLLVVPKVEDLKGKFKIQEEIVYTPDKKNRWVRSSIIVFIILLLTFAIFKYLIYIEEPEELSIAVIPFEVLSQDEATQLTGLRLTDNVIEKLSYLEGLHVISKQSLEHFSGMNKPIPEIAKDLHVNYVVQATVKKSDSTTIFVAIQLFNTKKNKFTWSEDFVENISDVSAIESEILKEVTDKLRIDISDKTMQFFETQPTLSKEAYAYYLKGKYHLMAQDSAYQSKSSRYFKQAISKDSSFVQPYIALAIMNWNAYLVSLDTIDVQLKQAAEGYLNKAVQINNEIPAAHILRGYMFMHHDDYIMAKKSFRNALEIAPNNLEARKGYAQLLNLQQDYLGQLEQAEIAHELDPMSYETISLYLIALANNQQFIKAQDLLDKITSYKSKQIDSLSLLKLNAKLYISQPDYAEAIPPLEKIVLKDNTYFSLLGFSYAKVGNVVNAYKVIDSIKQFDNSKFKNHRVAIVFAGLDELDSVLYYLDTIRNKQSRLLRQDRHLLFKEFEKNEAFEAILKAHKIDLE